MPTRTAVGVVPSGGVNRMRMSLTIALLIAARAYAGDFPEALRRAHEERLRAETGLVEWSQEDAAGDRRADRTVRFYNTRVAGDTILQTALGDEEGIVIRRTDGSVGPNGRRAFRSVHADGQIWTTQEGSLGADVWVDGGRMAPPPDVRTFGVQAQPGIRSVHHPNWLGDKDLEAARFREWTEGELHIVRAELPSGAALQWWIDPQKGWSIVRASQFGADGALKYESRSSVSEFDGTWLPTEIRYFKSGFQAGELPYQTIRVHSAEINRPEHPARLGPLDLGLDAGSQVTMHDPETLQGMDLRFWDGSALISTSEWQERLRAGTAADGPSFQRLFAEQRGQSAELALSDESAWERYTREFISKYELNDEQTQRAWLICRDCESDRDAYLRRHRDEFANLEKREHAAKGAAAITPAEDDRLAEQRRELEAPVQRIFDKRLKPRLDRLPTREQRARADGPTTRPARTP